MFLKEKCSYYSHTLFMLLVIRAENKLGETIQQNKNEYSNIQLLMHDELVMSLQ